MEYNAAEYEPGGIERLGKHVNQLLENALANPDSTLLTLDMLPEEECKQLLFAFNDTEAAYPAEKTLHQRFEEQVDKAPDQVAITAENDYPGMTYRELNESANRLAHLLIGNGVSPGAVVGIMLERSVYTVVGLLAILKTGSAYLPIETGLPVERIRYMLENAGANTLLTDSGAVKEIKFTELRNFEENSSIRIIRTPQRPHIRAFDSLPAPDRWLLDLRNYRNKIGMASVNNCISMQTTRGCPYECLYCHKVWSKHHVFRSAQNIYDEIEYYYKHGVKDFAVIDDCFNLNRENSMEMFRLIVKNKLDIQLYFPNGLRGDVMTPDYIDLMVEAGTRGINLSLETAAPRLQELLKKRLDLDKFKRVVDYIAEQHPNVILELATMHGFPSETEEEAMQTLEFIKGVKWLHFPYIHILKIFPNTEMEEFALKHGISKADIMKSKDRAFHELPETLPFPKSFTRKYQADFMNNYFMSPQRLRHVIPNQLKVVSEEALVQKYNAYLPTRIYPPVSIPWMTCSALPGWKTWNCRPVRSGKRPQCRRYSSVVRTTGMLIPVPGESCCWTSPSTSAPTACSTMSPNNRWAWSTC
jgi:pyruvate-formate lyase-activating enzyme